MLSVPRLAASVAVTALAVSAAACGSPSPPGPAPAGGSAGSGTFPAKVSTALGTVRIPQRPDRIVSLSPTATEMLYAIGAGSQVIAVDSDSDYPAKAPHTKLSALTPNVEAIVSYKPDLVVEAGDAGGLAGRLKSFDIPVLDQPAPATMAGSYSEFTQLGEATGHVAQAQKEERSIRGQLASIAASVPRPATPVTYYWELDQTYYSLTSATFVGSLLSMLGMKSIADSASGAASSGGYPQLSAEFIVSANPDYVILADTVCCHQSAATVAARPGWSSMTAVRDGHVIALNDDVASRWGPRVVDLLRAVAKAVSKGSSG